MPTHRNRSLITRVGTVVGAAVLGVAAAIIPLSAATASAPAQSAIGSSSSDCAATVVLVAQWQGGFMANVSVRNVGTATWPNWRARVTPPPGYVIYRYGVHLDPNLFYGYGPLAPGQSAQFSFLATGTGPAGPIGVVCGST